MEVIRLNERCSNKKHSGPARQNWSRNVPRNETYLGLIGLWNANRWIVRHCFWRLSYYCAVRLKTLRHFRRKLLLECHLARTGDPSQRSKVWSQDFFSHEIMKGGPKQRVHSWYKKGTRVPIFRNSMQWYLDHETCSPLLIRKCRLAQKWCS